MSAKWMLRLEHKNRYTQRTKTEKRGKNNKKKTLFDKHERIGDWRTTENWTATASFFSDLGCFIFSSFHSSLFLLLFFVRFLVAMIFFILHIGGFLHWCTNTNGYISYDCTHKQMFVYNYQPVAKILLRILFCSSETSTTNDCRSLSLFHHRLCFYAAVFSCYSVCLCGCVRWARARMQTWKSYATGKTSENNFERMCARQSLFLLLFLPHFADVLTRLIFYRLLLSIPSENTRSTKCVLASNTDEC